MCVCVCVCVCVLYAHAHRYVCVRIHTLKAKSIRQTSRYNMYIVFIPILNESGGTPPPRKF